MYLSFVDHPLKETEESTGLDYIISLHHRDYMTAIYIQIDVEWSGRTSVSN